MGLIVNQVNPWGGTEGRLLVTAKIVAASGVDVTGDEFYIFSTPELEEQRGLCFVARDRQGASILIATLQSAIRRLETLLAKDAE